LVGPKPKVAFNRNKLYPTFGKFALGKYIFFIFTVTIVFF